MSKIRNILTIIFVLALTSCMKDSTIEYRNVAMGNFTEGKFISDNGVIFNIRENAAAEFPDTVKRAFISCDILTQVGNDEYDIRLTGVNPVFTKAPVDSTAVTEPDIFVEDPLNIAEMWVSGGYINMFIQVPMKYGSTKAHLINLVRNDECKEEGTYEFTLKHNAFGEVITSADQDFIIGGTYASFPVSGILEGDNCVICIRWTSQKSTDTGWITETEKNTLRYEWTRGGYEHAL